MTVCSMTRSKVKITSPWKSEIRSFSKAISYLQLIGAGFFYFPPPFLCHVTLKLAVSRIRPSVPYFVCFPVDNESYSCDGNRRRWAAARPSRYWKVCHNWFGSNHTLLSVWHLRVLSCASSILTVKHLLCCDRKDDNWPSLVSSLDKVINSYWLLFLRQLLGDFALQMSTDPLLSSSAGLDINTNQGIVEVLCSWEGNRRCAVVSATSHRICGISVCMLRHLTTEDGISPTLL